MLRRSPITNPALWKEKVGYWDDVYGVRMGALKEFAVKSSFGTDCAVNVSAPDPLLSPPRMCLPGPAGEIVAHRTVRRCVGR